MEDTKIHLVKASFHAQFKVAMESCGVSAEKYFKKVRLPLAVDDPESLLPVKPFYQLINTFAINENVPDFGSIVARITPWHKVTSLAPLITSSRNLKDLLERFCQISNSQSSSVNFTFTDEDSHYEFCYTNTLDYNGDIQMEFYRISSMIQLVQLATGSKWRPETIRLIMPENALVDTCPLLKKSRIRFSQPISTISVALDRLGLPVHVEIPATVKPGAAKNAGRHAAYAESIRQIIDTYSLTGNITIEDIADITDQSVRTVQRRLRSAGLNFNELLSEAKFRHARNKLLNSDLPVAEIAKSLGYTDAAHFSRAFRRWAGVTPSSFRKNQTP
jgi:AraC-like DNA-binding protein